MDRKVFYDTIRKSFGPLTTGNVMGFNLVLDEGQKRGTKLHFLSYILATAWWESGKTMVPVEEAFFLGSKADGYRRRLRYYPYYGRGLVQLTWKDNYQKASSVVGVDLVNNPGKALDPKISVLILFDGMEDGWFTGRKLESYIDDVDESDEEDFREYREARRIVNGTDRAKDIADLAKMFENALRQAGYGGAKPVKESWWRRFINWLKGE